MRPNANHAVALWISAVLAGSIWGQQTTATFYAVATDSAPQTDGDIFVAPQNGPTEDGPMILDPKGRLVWFHATPVDQQLLTTDFRVSKLHGRKVLTWWQGDTNRGSGRGVGVIYNRRYRRVATVHAGNGLEADLHEFIERHVLLQRLLDLGPDLVDVRRHVRF